MKRALLDIRRGQARRGDHGRGLQAGCATFIKLAAQIKLDATFVNISFVGSDALAKELGRTGQGSS